MLQACIMRRAARLFPAAPAAHTQTPPPALPRPCRHGTCSGKDQLSYFMQVREQLLS
jgi:ribonuclease I